MLENSIQHIYTIFNTINNTACQDMSMVEQGRTIYSMVEPLVELH